VPAPPPQPPLLDADDMDEMTVTVDEDELL